ncbi:MAG: TetR/AcrR family transcriptional regulator [Pseudomonadota bacterium]
MKKTRRQNDTSVTRRAIEQEAARLMAVEGVAALNLSRIADSLQMTHGNIYRHFPSKGALAAEVAAQWMVQMRTACEKAVARKRTVRSRLLALVLTIREQLMLRADDDDALSVYEFVLKHKPAEALAHHGHRQQLVATIMHQAGWPRTDHTAAQADAILDGLRFFTDPYAISLNAGIDLSARLESLVELLSDYIERKT